MKNQISTILNKINILIKDNCFNNQYQQHLDSIYRQADTPKRNIKKLFNIPTCFKTLESIIVESKEIAKTLNDSELIIGKDFGFEGIHIVYYETNDEILERLNKDYIRLLKERDNIIKEEQEEYLRLKKKYD